ncbi:MAG TPA: type II secretion system F family protein [Candidatus Polarisedimenticolia bacterium]|nr:type II secretion system F family protein [Candidatus Polarisedimenticolia bacterium]
MLTLACVLIFFSITLLVTAFGTQVTLAPRRAAVDRLREHLPTTFEGTLTTAVLQPPKPKRWWERLLPFTETEKSPALTVVSLTPDSDMGRLLLYSGYRSRSSLRVFQLTRLTCALVLACIPLALVSRIPVQPRHLFLLAAVLGLVGFLLPKVYLRIKAARRQHRLRLSLPDALDLLVVCVEAGMGLNQAIVRVSEELRETHPEISDEFRLVNLEIRAGRTRPEALRSLGERTGVDDIISLASMIIQTDRFGTSIARSLRVHSDSLRTERRQRAEEAAAKTTIKLIFPLMFCIFPSLLVIILGPAALHFMHAFGAGGTVAR